MKILRISINNIASLSGTHTVDFTRDPLRTAGLFSISGPTGAGKSTLLDALCLALFDATPRLQQVGRLAELASGEKQNDPRMLLRRGAVEGFAEVAFVGVDGKSWTSRWSVRRSHRRADGTMQNVEMVLYRGHILCGGTGQVEEGGRKTAVLGAIAEKIGLTFEQFTRAVLLAQNDFATFLKADDKERAGILQALTGTERFEAISRAVYARAAAEKQAIESLELRLKGNAPLSGEERREAEAKAGTAAEKLTQLEQRLKELESHLEWFRQLARLRDEQTKAEAIRNQAIEKRDAAASRREELALTESVSRDARPLRNDALQAVADLASAKQALTAATETQEARVALKTNAESKRRIAETALGVAAQEQLALKPLLDQARKLDATLAPLHEQFAKAGESAVAARSASLQAAELLNSRTSQRTALLEEQESLQRERMRLERYLPFVADAAMWLDRIDSAIRARNEESKADEDSANLAGELQHAADRLKMERQSEPQLQAVFDAATKALQEAIDAESKLDAEQLAGDRSRCDINLRVLSRLETQLRELKSYRERAESIEADLRELNEALGKDTSELHRLQQQEIPAANHSFHAAKSQLELIEAAVSDHAKRLRTSLQEGQECPVCGALDHPYSQHEPDADATAVNAAKKSVNDFEKRRDEIHNQAAHLAAAIQSRSERIEFRQTEYQATLKKLNQISIESCDHPEVAAVLALSTDNQLTAVAERTAAINETLAEISKKDRTLRDAVRQTGKCRKAVEAARENLLKLQNQIVQLDREHDILAEKHRQAAASLEAAKKRRSECRNLLAELWAGLPAAESEFRADPDRFLNLFATGVDECRRVQKRLAELTADIQKLNAAIEPLQNSLGAAESALRKCESDLQIVTSERDRQLAERSLLFENRPADAVEAEAIKCVQTASKAFDDSNREVSEADRNLATANAELERCQRAYAFAVSKEASTQAELTTWLDSLSVRIHRQVSLAELDQMLARDNAWMKAERAALDQLNEAVNSAEGAFSAHAKTFAEHLALRPAPEEETAVLASIESQRADVIAAKEVANAARAVILSDNSRRQSNIETAAELERRRTTADPWLRLNELLGSADGAKFRMIAQRRTLDVLLRHANHQLNLLAGRYRLERLPESLNLIVIDREMGDEPRSVHSLSGGESFLVSLALALGLASLTSNRLRIESLFIDEGFGSLDQETLNTAMNALMYLEAQGRKVGVISHVKEMEDAIPVQIKVLKGRGGASRIVVPGIVQEIPAVAIGVASGSPTGGVAAGCSEELPDTIATRILEILHRERQHGKAKVSSRSVREEIGCEVREFKSAQSRLDGKIVTDGRSLRLIES